MKNQVYCLLVCIWTWKFLDLVLVCISADVCFSMFLKWVQRQNWHVDFCPKSPDIELYSDNMMLILMLNYCSISFCIYEWFWWKLSRSEESSVSYHVCSAGGFGFTEVLLRIIGLRVYESSKKHFPIKMKSSYTQFGAFYEVYYF